MIINKLISLFKKYKPTLLKTKKNLAVGKNTFHNGGFYVRGTEKIKIGSYGAFGRNITLITTYHDTNYIAVQGNFYQKHFKSSHPGDLLEKPNPEKTKGGIEIGNDVWIGDNVIILSGVKIGNGVCIAAGSIVTKDIEPYQFVAGVPAKIIKTRFSDEKIKFLEKIEWWNWSDEKIQQNKNIFFTDINKTTIEDLEKNLK